MKQFRFKQRQVYVRWTFGRATFAGETIAQRRFELFGFQGVMSVCPQFERGANDVGAAARGHDLIVCRNERWAHHAGLFKAAAAAVALLEIADKRSVLERKCEHGLERKFNWAREIFAQMLVDLVGL